MQRFVVRGSVVVAVGLIALGWISRGGDEAQERASDPTPDSVRRTVWSAGSSAPSGPTASAPVGVAAPRGAGEQVDLPAPEGPAEEALFAVARAEGRGVVRCAVDTTTLAEDVRDLLWRQAAIGPAGLTMLVEPSRAPGEPTHHAYTGAGTALSITYTDAFAGQLGACQASVRAFEPRPAPEIDGMQVRGVQVDLPDGEPLSQAPIVVLPTGAELDALLADAVMRAEDDLQAVERTVDPFQVALEQPGLSDEARAWLTERLEDRIQGAQGAVEHLGR